MFDSAKKLKLDGLDLSLSTWEKTPSYYSSFLKTRKVTQKKSDKETFLSKLECLFLLRTTVNFQESFYKPKTKDEKG